MIDKLFSTKVKITDINRILVEYCKQWVNIWCFELETKEEYGFLTMSFGNSWIPIEQKLNWAMLENKLWTLTSNLLFYPRNIGWCDM
jgi:hypothetical protein